VSPLPGGFDQGDFFVGQALQLIQELINLPIHRGDWTFEEGRVSACC
jgi:hypothetical protein